jgi:hypothetical protein
MKKWRGRQVRERSISKLARAAAARALAAHLHEICPPLMVY